MGGWDLLSFSDAGVEIETAKKVNPLGINNLPVPVPPSPQRLHDYRGSNLGTGSLRLDFFQRRKRLLWVSTGDRHVGSELCEFHGRLLPQSGVPARDYRCLKIGNDKKKHGIVCSSA